MTTQAQVHEMESPVEVRKTAEWVAGGSIGETIVGVSALVLSIIALAGIENIMVAAIVSILLGAALLLTGWSMGARYVYLIHETEGGLWSTAAELGGGITAAFLGGTAGVVLGLLVLLGTATEILLPVAAIVFGGTLLLTCGATSKVNYLRMIGTRAERKEMALAREAVGAASSLQVLFGLGAVVLGILALLHIHWAILTLVGLLAVSVSMVLSGAAVSGRFWGIWHQDRE
jgi:hypothetical protein